MVWEIKQNELKNFFNFFDEDRKKNDFLEFLTNFIYNVIMESHINTYGNSVIKSNKNILFDIIFDFFYETRPENITKSEYKTKFSKRLVNDYLTTIEIDDSSVGFPGIDYAIGGVVIEEYGNFDTLGLLLYNSFNVGLNIGEKDVSSTIISNNLIKVMKNILGNISGYYSGYSQLQSGEIKIFWNGLSII